MEKLQSPLNLVALGKTWIYFLPGLFVLILLLSPSVRRRISDQFHRLRYRNNSRAATINFYAQSLDLLKAHGFNRKKEQTPMEFARSLSDHPAGLPFLSLTCLYNAARFGGPDILIAPSEAQALLRSLRSFLKPHTRN